MGRGLQPFPLAGGCTQTPAGRGTCPRSMYPVPGRAVPQPLDLPSAVLPTSCLCWPASPLCVSSARCNSGAARAGPASGVMRQAVIGQRIPTSASARTEGKTWGKHLLFAFVTVGLANLGANDWECLSQNKTKNQTTKKRSAWSCSGCLSRRFSSQGWRRSAEQFFFVGSRELKCPVSGHTGSERGTQVGVWHLLTSPPWFPLLSASLRLWPGFGGRAHISEGLSRGLGVSTLLQREATAKQLQPSTRQSNRLELP